MRLVGAVALCLLTAAGCTKGSTRSAKEAFQELEKAVAAGDAALLWEVVDSPTRKAVEGTWEAEKLQRDIVRTKFPPDKQGPELARLQAAAADDVRGYFLVAAKERRMAERYRKRLGGVSGPILEKVDGESIWVARKDGMPFRFVKEGKGWAFGELAAEWRLEEERARHGVTTVRENAALYEKAQAQ